MYRLCKSCLQGSVVPRLAAGHVGAGVYAIATTRIDGTPLSALAFIPEQVTRAAERALACIHAEITTFCHGDIRLENMLVVQRDVGPVC